LPRHGEHWSHPNAGASLSLKSFFASQRGTYFNDILLDHSLK
jgi:hypothetical protein